VEGCGNWRENVTS